MPTLRVFTGENGAAEYREYRLQPEPNLTLLAALTAIFEDLDPSLAYRHYCCQGNNCNSCLVRVNGRTTRSCCYVLQAGESITVEPLDKGAHVKDLVVQWPIVIRAR